MKKILIILSLFFLYSCSTTQQIQVNCSEPRVINESPFSWDLFDTGKIKESKRMCKDLYNDNPCLVKFIKVSKRSYLTTCGKKVDKKS